MTEVKKKTTTKKATAARKVTKKEPVKKEVMEQVANPMEQMMNMMTPEMVQQFMVFMQQQNQQTNTVEVAKGEKPKLNKTYLSKIRENEVVIRSVSMGTVGFQSRKTGMFYKWVNFGDTEVLTVGEILEMENSSKDFLHTPYLVVEDDEVNEALGLFDVKDDVEVFDDIETFLELSSKEIKEHLSKLDKTYLRNVGGKIQQAIDDGILTDVRKIREIEKLMKADFKY